MGIPLSPCVPENLVSRDGFSRPVPRQSAHLHTYAESGAYLRDSSRVPRRRPYETAIRHRVSPELSGHAVAYRWRSLPRVRRHRASKPQGSSERVLPWQITMDQLIFASLSHTHYWYEVGMLKVPAEYRMLARFLPRPPGARRFGWVWLGGRRGRQASAAVSLVRKGSYVGSSHPWTRWRTVSLPLSCLEASRRS